MGSGWLKGLTGRLLSSTTAVALAAALAPESAHARIIVDNGGSSPTTADYIGEVTAGDQISFADVTLPTYWEFTWSGVSSADISSQGTYDSYLGDNNPYKDLELYTATGKPPSSTNLIDSSAFAETNFVPTELYLGTGYVDADLPNLTLTPGAEYVVGISAQNVADPTGTVNFNAVGVPEPASLTLLGSLVTAFGLLRRRRGAPRS